MATNVSVVIPALDEAAEIGGAIASVLGQAAEIIVVDGGSRDGTVAVAAALGCLVLRALPCRGSQLDTGARAAGGEWLVFLHADTRLEAGWEHELTRLGPRVAGGAYRFTVDSERPAYRLIESAVALRCRLAGLPYGDQAIFARREAYLRAGGFRHLPLMEDVDFVRHLRRVGPLAFLPVRAFTSPRRWERRGLVATTLRNWWTFARYAAGWPPARLARDYREEHAA